jgi:hypothetical protein
VELRTIASMSAYREAPAGTSILEAETRRGASGFEWSLGKALLVLPDGTQIAE